MRNPIEVMEEVAKDYGIHINQIRGRSRVQEFVRARIEVAKRMKSEGFSYSEIARTMNRHASAIHHYFHP